MQTIFVKANCKMMYLLFLMAMPLIMNAQKDLPTDGNKLSISYDKTVETFFYIEEPEKGEDVNQVDQMYALPYTKTESVQKVLDANNQLYIKVSHTGSEGLEEWIDSKSTTVITSEGIYVYNSDGKEIDFIKHETMSAEAYKDMVTGMSEERNNGLPEFAMPTEKELALAAENGIKVINDGSRIEMIKDEDNKVIFDQKVLAIIEEFRLKGDEYSTVVVNTFKQEGDNIVLEKTYEESYFKLPSGNDAKKIISSTYTNVNINDNRGK
jgi:hypothetical protein